MMGRVQKVHTAKISTEFTGLVGLLGSTGLIGFTGFCRGLWGDRVYRGIRCFRPEGLGAGVDKFPHAALEFRVLANALSLLNAWAVCRNPEPSPVRPL